MAAQTSTNAYTKATTTNLLPEYKNTETDKIRDAFTANNFGSLSKLPWELQAGTVMHARASGIQENLRSGVGNGTVAHHKPLQRRGLFHEFEYIPSKYNLADELKRHERAEAVATMDTISQKQFVYAGTGKRLKHEDSFEDRAWRYPYMDDPFEGADEQERRLKWINESKVIQGPFLPTGVAKALHTPSRSQLPDMIKQLHEIMRVDWGTSNFSVMATQDDIIAVRFELNTIGSERALRSYMNVFAETNVAVLKYRLRRIIEDWNTKPGDGFVYFMFSPPWVHVAGTQSFFSLHPEERAVSSSRISST